MQKHRPRSPRLIQASRRCMRTTHVRECERVTGDAVVGQWLRGVLRRGCGSERQTESGQRERWELSHIP